MALGKRRWKRRSFAWSQGRASNFTRWTWKSHPRNSGSPGTKMKVEIVYFDITHFPLNLIVYIFAQCLIGLTMMCWTGWSILWSCPSMPTPLSITRSQGGSFLTSPSTLVRFSRTPCSSLTASTNRRSS